MMRDCLELNPLDWADLREWLRYHNQWSVLIEPWGIYGTTTITASFNGKQVYYDRGEHLGRRVRHFLEWVTTFHDSQPLGNLPWCSHDQRVPFIKGGA